ncbi:MAG TPA: hypothetical protein VFE42_30210 [Chloroflexota bacterium]|nr:hypothetical protein [Chloroflexota bacterium]
MPTHTIQISEELYDRLYEQAVQLQLTPEQLIERLLAGGPVQPVVAPDEPDIPVPQAGTDEALAAVQRLTTLFADAVIPDLDHTLADPMIALANADAAPAPGYS